MKCIKFILTILIPFIFIGCECENNNREHQVRVLYSNKTFELRKFKMTTMNKSSFSGGYFLVAGGISGSSEEKAKIKFSWKIPTGEFIISEIEIYQLKVRIDNTITKPYISFDLDDRGGWWWPDPQQFIDQNVRYVVVHCNEKDYSYDNSINTF